MPFNPIDEVTGDVVWGVVPYNYQQALDILNINVIANISKETNGEITSVDTSDKTVLGKLNMGVATRVEVLYNEIMDIQRSLYVDSATGSSLNKLALQVGFNKESATQSFGDIRCFGNEDTLVSEDVLFSSLKGDKFYNTSDFIISSNNCLSLKIKVLKVIDSRQYTITLDTREYTITSSPSSTFHSVLTQLKDRLSVDVTVDVTISTDEEEDSYITITKDDQTSTMSVASSALLSNYSVEVVASVKAENSGIIFGDADTITEIVTSVSGLDSINNPIDFILGRFAETDDELRVRIKTEYRTTGSGTHDTIEAILSGLEEVRSVSIDANSTFTTNAYGVPAKNYEVILSHTGGDDEIAEIIWDTKPLGIDTHGDTTVVITDKSNLPQDVRFTNATDEYLHVKVDITKLDSLEGENYPANGDILIQNAIANLGNSLKINEDVINKRFYGAIFNSASGIASVDVKVWANSTPVIDPNLITEWKTKEPMGREEISTFGTNRVFINDLT